VLAGMIQISYAAAALTETPNSLVSTNLETGQQTSYSIHTLTRRQVWEFSDMLRGASMQFRSGSLR
jgi:hypothetical protein